jgi:hypothetical protein
VYQEVKKQQNIESVIDKAYEELEKEKEVSEEPVDKDWSFRFFQYVADICDEDMQKIWGKILAGEVKQPRSCSLRTLERVRSISKPEAELFTKISTLVMQNGDTFFIPNEKTLYEKYGIKFSDFLNINDCGLIDTTPTVLLSLTLQKNEQNSVYNKQIVGMFSPTKEVMKIELQAFPLTEAGKQLYKILNLNTDKNFAIDYFKLLKNKHTTINIAAYNIELIIYDANAKQDIIKIKGEDLLQ